VKLPWNKTKNRDSKWAVSPQKNGLLISWLVDGTPVSATETSIIANVSEAHLTIYQHLQLLLKEQLVIDNTPILMADEKGFLFSTMAVYAGIQRIEQNNNDEAVSTCQGICDWLNLVVEKPLPDELPIIVTLKAQWNFASVSFSIHSSILPPASRARQHREIGPFLEYTDGQIDLLPKEVYQLLQEVREPWPREPLERLRRWAMLKPRALEIGAELDGYLAGEDAVIVEKIEPSPVSYSEGKLRLKPRIIGADDDVFASVTEKFSKTQPQYNVEDKTSSGRTRFILSPDAEGALDVLKKHTELSGSEAIRSLMNADEIFSSPGFSLEDYSKRVIGVGIYVYRALPYLGTPGEKRDWFSWDGADDDIPDFGMLLESDCDNSTNFNISLTDPKKRKEIQQKLQNAYAQGEPYIEVTLGHFISCLEASQLLEQAEALADSSPKQRQKLVFQIWENIERREYSSERFAHVSHSILLPPPDMLSADYQLLAHQVSGYSWLCAQGNTDGIGAALLADEMGLGKTLQVLCMLAERRRNGGRKPILIVAPISLLENWQREAKRFFPSLFMRCLILNNRSVITEQNLNENDLVLSSYETLRGSIQFEVGKVSWDVLILDEAQRIKNPTTQTSIAIKSLKAEFRVAMTATPVENSLAELWNIVDFLLPGYLTSLREFHQNYILAWQNGLEANREAISQELIKKLQPILLRRMKHEVLDLPEKRPAPMYIPMSPLQEKLYADIIRQTKAKELHPLAAIRQLLYVCAHPGLVDPIYVNDICPKLQYTLQVLETIQQAGEKVLIFTGSLRLQTLLRRVFEKQLSISVEIVNGSTPATDRQKIIDNFSDRLGFAVLLLSPRAAGLGLNITAATHVIHYTREWNPAIEAQSTDRTHRIGQTRSVTVHYPIVSGGMIGSAEQKLDELLQEKSILATSIVRPSSDQEVNADEMIARILQ
jgi:hypothetical protein